VSIKKGKIRFGKGFPGVKSIVVFLMVFALLFAAFFCIEERVDSRRRQLDYERETLALRSSLSSKASELTNLNQKYIDSLGHRGTVSLLLLSLNESFVDIFDGLSLIESETETLRLPFVMALSEDNIPGTSGNISMEKYLSLKDEGWGDCLYYGGDPTAATLEEWLSVMSAALTSREIDMPKSLFCSGGYGAELDRVALEYGIDILCLRENTLYPLIESTAGDGGVWHPGVIGWNTVGSSRLSLNELARGGGHFTFTVGPAITDDTGKNVTNAECEREEWFPLYPDLTPRDDYVVSIKKMIDKVLYFDSLSQVEFATLEEGYAKRVDYLDRYSAILPIIETEKARLENEIAAIEKELYDKLKEYAD
jgi:hypothetical protein